MKIGELMQYRMGVGKESVPTLENFPLGWALIQSLSVAGLYSSLAVHRLKNAGFIKSRREKRLEKKQIEKELSKYSQDELDFFDAINCNQINQALYEIWAKLTKNLSDTFRGEYQPIFVHDEMCDLENNPFGIFAKGFKHPKGEFLLRFSYIRQTTEEYVTIDFKTGDRVHAGLNRIPGMTIELVDSKGRKIIFNEETRRNAQTFLTKESLLQYLQDFLSETDQPLLH